MLLPLDGPAVQIKLTAVDTITPVEVKVGASALIDRAVITIQPNGNIKVYFSDGSSFSSYNLANGFDHYKSAKETYEAGVKQKVYILASSGTVNVVIVERA